MANILMVSSEGNSCSLGWRLTKEGHSVLMWIKEKQYERVGDGFVKKTPKWEGLKATSDLIIFDDTGFGKICDELRKEGKRVWGGCEWSDQIELDRFKGVETFKQIGMTTIPSKEFTRLEEGLAFVKAHPGRYCVKLSGKISEEKALTYVGKEENGLDMISILENYKAKWAAKIDKFELQEVKDGIEVAIGGFFNGNDFVEPILVNFEHKKLMPGDIGPASGEMGTSAVWMRKNKIYKESLGRCVALLKEHKYVGYFDINCIAEGKILWPLEFTSRFGYPTTQLKLETMKVDLGDWMVKMASGSKEGFDVFNPYTICVVMGTPPYPFTSKELYQKYGEDQEILFVSKDKRGFWPGEARREEDQWYVTGENGWTLIVAAGGNSIQEAQKKTYSRIKNVIIPHSFWRNDIGSRTEERLKILHSNGWFA